MNKLIRIGILLPHLGPTQMAYEIITALNITLMNKINFDFTLFVEEILMPCTKPLCAIMNIAEIHAYHGNLITTTIQNTMFTLGAVAIQRRFFYLWDLEWLRLGRQNYLQNMSVYRNSNIQLITRSQSHADQLNEYCGNTSVVIPNYQFYQLFSYIEKTNGNL